ncbi:MAG: sugar ABC transporter permease [Chloroflexi bacterium]|nr:sugar ABC transporter permease [Chloroflexota bacterium]
MSNRGSIQYILANKMVRDRWLGYLGRLIIVLAALSFAFFPIIWIASAAFDETGTLNTQRLIPRQAGTENFDTLLSSDIHPFEKWIFNSIKVASISALLGVTISALGAYAFSRFRFSGRRNLMLTIFIVQVFPNSLTIVATFLLIQSIGKEISWFGLNSHGGLILVYLGGALGINTWLMKGFFDSIPRELDESARIDGASDTLIFVRIILPLVRPVLAVVGILSFIGTYGDVIISLTLLKDKDLQTLAIGLNRFISDQFDQNWGVFSAGALIGAIPIVILILTFQRFFVSGLTEGAVKG